MSHERLGRHYIRDATSALRVALALPLLFTTSHHSDHFADTGLWTKGNILPDSTAAPSLQGHQKDLEKHMRADSLDNKLQNRPKPDDLVNKGILQSPVEES